MDYCDYWTSKYTYAISENHLTHEPFFCITPSMFTPTMECCGWWSGQDALWLLIWHATLFCTLSKLRLWNVAISEPAITHKYVFVIWHTALFCAIYLKVLPSYLPCACTYYYTYRKILIGTSQSGLLVHNILLWSLCNFSPLSIWMLIC